MSGPETLERLALIADPETLARLGIDLEQLSDPDTRAEIIRADHPDLDRAPRRGENEVLVNGEPMNPRLHFAMHEVVANQIADEDPPDVYRTARRLLDAGYHRHEVLHMLADAMTEQIHAALTDHETYDPNSHIAALDALPEAWEQQRPDPPTPPLNRAERRAHARRRRRPR
ncbi:MAG: DUF1841 family protein [Actinomycetota bacterium]|nr:DUF1841 family protein [Actinomycetota bacterium]